MYIILELHLPDVSEYKKYTFLIIRDSGNRNYIFTSAIIMIKNILISKDQVAFIKTSRALDRYVYTIRAIQKIPDIVTIRFIGGKETGSKWPHYLSPMFESEYMSELRQKYNGVVDSDR